MFKSEEFWDSPMISQFLNARGWEYLVLPLVQTASRAWFSFAPRSHHTSLAALEAGVIYKEVSV